jgi:glucose/arabinose dehydrogenase
MTRLAALLAIMAGLLVGASGAMAVGLSTVGTGFSSAVGVVQAPGESRLLVVERNGLVRPIGRGGRPGAPWLDIRSRVGADGLEQGLLGLAFAPDFARSGRFYVNFTNRSGDTRVVEFRTRPGARSVPVRTARTVLGVDQPFDNHNGGALQFGPDRMLYVALGDGGGQGDPGNRAQDPGSLLGKVLRIDPSRRSAGRGYAIPPGNPFASVKDARPEIWLLGLRNPWRISFDRATGDLWIGDVGEREREEVDVARAGQSGLDFGWRKREGTIDYKGGARGEREVGPVAEYPHDDGNCSITGGYVYRGTAAPSLTGRYLYADWCTGQSWSIDAARPGAPQDLTREIGRIAGVNSFGEDRAGNVYVVTNRSVRRITG